jgi:hypothetical protein
MVQVNSRKYASLDKGQVKKPEEFEITMKSLGPYERRKTQTIQGAQEN